MDETTEVLQSEHPHMDNEHLDAACALLNVEAGVLSEIAGRDYGIDEVQLTVAINEPIRSFLVEGFGEAGATIFDKFSGGTLPEDLDNAELAATLKERFANASLDLAMYMLASRWSVNNVLQQAGATEEDLMSAWREVTARLTRLFGEPKAEETSRLAYEFNAAVTGVP